MISTLPLRNSGLAAAALFLLTGCFSEGSNNDFTDVTDPEVQAAKVREQLVPGAFNIGTLAVAAFGQSEATFLVAEQLNRLGGVMGGRPVNIVLLETEDDPPGTRDAKIRGMVLAGIQVIMMEFSSDALAAVPITAPEGVLVIGSSTTSPELSDVDDDDLLFRTAPSDAAQGEIIADLAIEQVRGLAPTEQPRASILFQDGDAYSEGIRDRFALGFAARGGKIVDQVGFSEATADAAVGQVFAPVPAPPHIVLLASLGSPDPAASAVIAWSSRGAPLRLNERSPWIFPDALVQDFFLDNLPANVRADLNGTPATAPALGVSDDQVPDEPFDIFAADFEKHAGFPPTVFASNTYDAAVLIALAAERAFTEDGVTEPSGAAIAAHLRAVANPSDTVTSTVVTPGETSLAQGLAVIRSGGDIDYQGAYSAFDFDARGDIVGQLVYTVFGLDAQNATYTEEETVTIEID